MLGSWGLVRSTQGGVLFRRKIRVSVKVRVIFWVRVRVRVRGWTFFEVPMGGGWVVYHSTYPEELYMG